MDIQIMVLQCKHVWTTNLEYKTWFELGQQSCHKCIKTFDNKAFGLAYHCKTNSKFYSNMTNSLDY